MYYSKGSEYGNCNGRNRPNHLFWEHQSRHAPNRWSHTGQLDGAAHGGVLHIDDAHLVARPGRGEAL